MPIEPPNLDDRRYDDIMEEMMQLIPQYCPEWTNLGPADPGVTMVQLFAWMTELILYRVNRVPDKTYIHFLNFIGEERKVAKPSVVPVSFSTRLNSETAIEVPAYTTCATRQTEDRMALNFLTTSPVSVHSATIQRLIAVKGGPHPLVRDIPFDAMQGSAMAVHLNKGKGIQVFEMDPVEYGAYSYTPHQFLYIAHDDFQLMDVEHSKSMGRLEIAMGEDKISALDFFDWEYPTNEGWKAIQLHTKRNNVFRVEEKGLSAALPGIREESFNVGGVGKDLPERVREQKWWIRGQLNYDRWLVEQMKEDLQQQLT